MKYFVLFLLVSFFIVFNVDVNAKVEQSLNEYKIEQLQKGIDELKKEIEELKKDVDDTKEKKIENKKDNESLDKRIGDINDNVDRFGIIAGILGLFITIALAISGWLGYTKAKTESKDVAKEEAEKVTKNWINNEANKQLQEKIKELEIDAQEKIAEAVQNAKDELKQQSKAEEFVMEGNNNIYKKDYETAEKYYFKALNLGNNAALNNLGNLYKDTKQYDKAEEYYLKAIDIGINDSLYNLGNLYFELEKYIKAKEYYTKAKDLGDNDALNNLAYLNFKSGNEAPKALELIEKAYDIQKEYVNTHTLATILLWNEKFTKSYEKFEEWMKFKGALENFNDISEYLTLLISKGQYYKAKEYFENEKYQLKDKLKPIWYALMTLMQDEFPNEIKEMGSELQTSVDDILKTIEELKQKYKI